MDTTICVEIFFQDDGIPSHIELEQCDDEYDDEYDEDNEDEDNEDEDNEDEDNENF